MLLPQVIILEPGLSKCLTFSAILYIIFFLFYFSFSVTLLHSTKGGDVFFNVFLFFKLEESETFPEGRNLLYAVHCLVRNLATVPKSLLLFTSQSTVARQSFSLCDEDNK